MSNWCPEANTEDGFISPCSQHVRIVFLEGYCLSAKLSGKWSILWWYCLLISFQANYGVVVLKKQTLHRDSPYYPPKRSGRDLGLAAHGAVPAWGGVGAGGSGLAAARSLVPGGLLVPSRVPAPQPPRPSRRAPKRSARQRGEAAGWGEGFITWQQSQGSLFVSPWQTEQLMVPGLGTSAIEHRQGWGGHRQPSTGSLQEVATLLHRGRSSRTAVFPFPRPLGWPEEAGAMLAGAETSTESKPSCIGRLCPQRSSRSHRAQHKELYSAADTSSSGPVNSNCMLSGAEPSR